MSTQFGATSEETGELSQGQTLFRRALRIKELMVIFATLVVIIGFVIAAPRTFLTAKNIGAILTASAQLGAVALGASVLMIAGEFDISVGSNYAFSGILMGFLNSHAHLPVWASLLIGLIVATGIGLSNGAITLAARIPSFITTLGAWLIWFGLALAVSKGFFVEIDTKSPLLKVIGGYLGNSFYASIIWWIVLAFILLLMLNRTAFGNWIFAVGGKADAARAVGVPVVFVKMFAFGLAGFMSGVGAVFTLGQQGSVAALYGRNLPLLAIAAGVVGGCSLFGGAGSIVGVVLGAILISMINSGLILAGAPTFWYETFVGIIVVIAVVINTAASRRVMQMK